MNESSTKPASRGCRVLGLALNERQRLQHRIVQMGGDLLAFLVADTGGAGRGGGFGQRYKVDPVLVRVALVVSTIFGGAGIVLYLLA